MSVEDNKALVRRSIEAENRADLGMLEDCYASDYVHHDPDNPAVQDWPGLKEAFLGYFAAFPDGHVVIDDLIAEGDKVVKRWTSRSTHLVELRPVRDTATARRHSARSLLRNEHAADTARTASFVGRIDRQSASTPPQQMLRWCPDRRENASASCVHVSRWTADCNRGHRWT